MIRSGPDFIYNIVFDSKELTQTSLELSPLIYAIIFYSCGLFLAWGFEKTDGCKHSNSTFTFLSIALTFVSFVVMGIGFVFISIVHPFSFGD